MAKPDFIEFSGSEKIPILYEDRSVLAIDKPPWWMLVPFSWQNTNRNLQAAIASSIAAGDFWARSRNLKFLRHVHRLDAETTGVLLFGKSSGAVQSLSDLFEDRRMQKRYLAVVRGVPSQAEWTCSLAIGPDPRQIGKMRVDAERGKSAETAFKVLHAGPKVALIEARPVTGRTHQIRIHLAQAGLPILGDPLYGVEGMLSRRFPLGLRAASLAYRDPFNGREISIRAPLHEFLKTAGMPEADARCPS